MTVGKVLLAVALVLFLLSLIRVGGEMEYSSEGFWVKVRVGALKFRVFPVQKKKEKQAKTKPEKKQAKTGENEGKPPSKKGGSARLVKSLLPLVGEAVGGLKRRIRVDRLELAYTAAGAADAAGAAMAFGYANAAIGAIFPVFEQNFELKDYHIHAGVNFRAKDPEIYLNAAFSGRIGSLLFFSARLGLKFLTLWRRQQKESETSSKTPENPSKTPENRANLQKEAI